MALSVAVLVWLFRFRFPGLLFLHPENKNLASEKYVFLWYFIFTYELLKCLSITNRYPPLPPLPPKKYSFSFLICTV